MKRVRFQREEMIPRLFALTAEGVEYRNRIRSLAGFGAWAILSGLTLAAFIFLATNNLQRLAIAALSALKYLPLFAVIYALARTKAAHYLADVFELEDETLAYDFIEDVAFGSSLDHVSDWSRLSEKDRLKRITINEGRISERDERSPVIRIGGPGYVQVNLDSAALLERVDGTPEIIEPRDKAWKLGCFERIREIGKSDEPGKREYAIVNLRDQFVRGLTVRTRTKDGIPIEAQDIKVMFSILRKPREEAPEDNPYHYDENAIYSLVYDQIIITPPPAKVSGVSFPWDTTVLPLVTGELEKIITSRSLSQILASISRRELDELTMHEAANKQMRIEMTSEQATVPSAPGGSKPPEFLSRSRITAQFFSDEFKVKAAALGVAVHWIDIGTWQLPSEIVIEELKSAWRLMGENAKRAAALERAAKRYEMKELMDLVNHVVISNYSRSGSSGSSRKLSEKEYLELAKIIGENPEIGFSPMLQQRFSHNAASKRDTHTVALDILKAFRRELIAAREMIEKENRSSVEKQAEIGKIEKALRDIDFHVFHYVKRPS
jgi:hypothetical protein